MYHKLYTICYTLYERITSLVLTQLLKTFSGLEDNSPNDIQDRSQQNVHDDYVHQDSNSSTTKNQANFTEEDSSTSE